MRNLHRLLGDARRYQGQLEIRGGLRHVAILARCGRRAQNTIIGGATLWVLRTGRAPNTREWQNSSATFEARDSSAWHQNTGYLPITRAAFDLTRAQGFYDRNPGTAISIEQITLKPPTENSRGVRLGSFVLIRDVIDERTGAGVRRQEIRAGRAGFRRERGDRLLRQFERANPDR